MLGVTTIGNATLMAHDDKPVLVTDPWLGEEDHAYFGSWNLPHLIPSQQKQDILQAKYVWISHYHPDHLNPLSIKKFKNRIILLADQVGQRLSKGLIAKGFKVQILKDKTWVNISKNIKILCIADYLQDSLLLVDVNGRLFVNLNDSGGCGHLRFIKNIVKQYDESYLLKSVGYGAADMINIFNEQGKRLPPRIAGHKLGYQLSLFAEKLGVNHCIPFANFSHFQRQDSFWANEYETPIASYKDGFKEALVELIGPFVFVDCSNGQIEKINPTAVPPRCIDPKEFGDDWEEPLQKGDRVILDEYWERKKLLKDKLSFINFRVGGIDNFIDIGGPKNKGITFEVPRNSLMEATKHEYFDDLLIGNFMKTTMHGIRSLHSPPIAAIVGNFADNGMVETKEDFAQYMNEYKKRAGWELSRYLFERNLVFFVNRFVPRHSKFFPMLKNIYFRLKSAT
jgi:hypothetical protein